MAYSEHSMQVFLLIFLLLLVASAAPSTSRIGQAENLVLAGPSPNGWTIQFADVKVISDEIFWAMDVGSMGELTSVPLQRSVFESGLRRNNTKMSLRDFGRTASNFEKNPLFHFYVDAFEEIGTKYEKQEKGLFDEHPVGEYLSTIIDDLLSLNMPSNIIKDSSLVMEIFMKVQTHIGNLLDICTQSASSSKDPNDALINLDHAAALWIGFGQTYGDNENGNMLYGLAERAGANFGQDDGETKVNTEILSLMSELRTIFTNMLSSSSATTASCASVRPKVARIQALLFVPLVQNLIHHMWNGDGNYVELYSLCILPPLRSCDPSSFDDLMNKLVLKTYQETSLNVTLTQVQRLYSCMNIKCDDVGGYLNGLIPECSDSLYEQRPTFWQEYNITFNNVTKYAKVDRDIKQFDILLQRSQFGLARDLYSNGRNMRDVEDDMLPISLQNMAIQEGSQDAFTFLYLFEEFFQNQSFGNIDTFMLDTLNDHNSDSNKELALRLLQTIIAPHYAFKNFFGSLNSCLTGDLEGSARSWDIGSAVILGSIPKDSNAPQSARFRSTWYSLALEMCQFFGCNAVLAHSFTRCLEGGKSAINGNNCADLQTQVKTMENLLFVPFIHGALDAAVKLEKNASNPVVIGSAKAYALAVTPLVQKVSKSASKQIYDRLTAPNAGSVNGIVDDVFKAFARSWYDLGIDCSLIGTYFSSSTSFCAFIDTVEPETIVPTTSPAISPLPIPTMSPSPSPLSGVNLLHPSFSGRYNFTYNVTMEALLSDDILNMSSSDLSVANEVYDKSFSRMTKNMSSYLNKNPYYSFYSYAFRDDPNLPNHSSMAYSSAIVSEALAKSNGAFASETVVIVIVWMNVINLLYSAVADCKKNVSPVTNIDSAVALYIGANQSKGKADGYMLYNLGQKYGHEYNTIGEDGESNANRKVIEAFASARKIAFQCRDPNVFQWLELRQIVQLIIAQMNVPILQGLDHYLSRFSSTFDRDDGNHLKLYALASLPQVATCLPNLYDQFFRISFIDRNFLDTNDSEKDALRKVMSDAKVILKNIYSCFGTSTPEVLGVINDTTQLPDNYNLSIESKEYSYIDRDISKIEALLYFDSTALALELYEFGHSSQNLSLQMLARDPKRATSLEFKSFTTFFSDEFYADSIILSAFRRPHATSTQANTTIEKTAQTMVLFMGTLQHLYTAVNLCRSNAIVESQIEWDKSFALFIGSAVEFHGNPDSANGRSIYALAKEICVLFNTCPAVDNIIGAFRNGKDLLLQYCDGASQIIEDMIKPALLIPLIQATLDASNKIEQGIANGDNINALAAGNVYALSLIPLVNAIDAEVAKSISMTLGIDANSLFAAFKSVLPKLNILCSDLGTMGWLHTESCDATGGEGASVSGSIYKTVTNVTNLARIDLDVQFILKALIQNQATLAEDIYTNGFHSIDATGQRNLADFSLKAAQTMTNDNTYNLYKFSFADKVGESLSGPGYAYGDRIVRSFFNDTSVFSLSTDSTRLPIDAAIALNLWLYVTHQLHSSVAQCQSAVANISYIDAAAAYWIGSIPLAGNGTDGYLLYSLAEEASNLFGQHTIGRASPANAKLMALFKQATILLSSPRACQEGSTTASHLRSVVFQCISQMTIPLIQQLIAKLKSGDRPRVKIYSYAVVPLLVRCRSSAYAYLKSKLIDSSYSESDLVEIISTIEGEYECLGLSCGDIGSYQGMKTCIDSTPSTSIAGFVPTSDIRAVSKLDLDVKEIEIMLATGATSVAKDVYFNGRNSHLKVTTGGDEFLSLYSLAIDDDRNIVPDFKLFFQYYKDSHYAHTAIADIIKAVRENTYSQLQGSLLVRNTLSYLILPMASLQRLYISIAHCNSGAVTSSRTSWNEAAAMLIGSLEGSNEEGVADNDGYLTHFWANYLCNHFGVCEMGYARVNRIVILLLNSGRAALDANQCSIAEEHASQISKSLLIPFIQGSLLYSSENTLIHSKEAGLHDFMHTAGFVSSRYILPYVYSVDPHGASLIDRYLNFEMDSKDDRSSTREVFQVLQEAIIKLSGIDCVDVGRLENLPWVLCHGQTGSSFHRSSGLRWLWSLLLLLPFGLFIWKKKKEREGNRREHSSDEEEITFPQDTDHKLD